MRYARINKIKELIKLHEIDTQETLAQMLRECGFNVTQATVSRDIKELNLIKTTGPSGKSIYAQPEAIEIPPKDKLKKVLAETITSITPAENLIVIKTISGCANAAGEAIDTAGNPQIVGTLAGDNTLLVVVDKKENVPQIMQVLKELLQ